MMVIIIDLMIKVQPHPHGRYLHVNKCRGGTFPPPDTLGMSLTLLYNAAHRLICLQYSNI